MAISDWYSMFPPGFRFSPNDVELIEAYLKPLVNGCSNYPGRIHEVNIYEHSPQELDEKYRRQGENATYFFSPRNRKYPNGSRPDRAVGENIGFWKATGKDFDIRKGGRIIGYRKALVYIKGTYKNPIKTSWLMQEFRLNPEENNNIIAPQNFPSTATRSSKMRLDDCVLCKIYDRAHKQSGDQRKYSGAQLEVEVPKKRREEKQNGEPVPKEEKQKKSNNPAMPTGYMVNDNDFSNPPLAFNHPATPTGYLVNVHDFSNPAPAFLNNTEVQQLEVAADSLLTLATSMPPLEDGCNPYFLNPPLHFPNNMELGQLEERLAADSMLTLATSMPPLQDGCNPYFLNPPLHFPNNMEVGQLEERLAAHSMLTMASSIPSVTDDWNPDFLNPPPPFPMEVEQLDSLPADDSMLSLQNGSMLSTTMDCVDHLIDYSNIAHIISEYEARLDFDQYPKEPLEFYLDDPSLVQTKPLDDPSPPKDLARLRKF